MPLAHLEDRALLRLSGPDTRAFLQGQITNDIGLLAPGQPLYAGLLSPQGKALFAFILFADGEDVLLDCAAADREDLARRLLMFRLRSRVEIAPEDGLCVFADWGRVATGHAPDPRHPPAGTRWLAEPGSAAPDASLEDWHRHRLAQGLAEADEIGRDTLLWLETNARELNGVSFTKGCFVGQENTARMHYRDRLRKRLLPLCLPAEAPAAGPVMAGEREAGQLRGARHGGLQFGLLRVEALGAPLTVEGHPARLALPPWLPATAA
jgi:folate-binding protein YgfZ